MLLNEPCHYVGRVLAYIGGDLSCIYLPKHILNYLEVLCNQALLTLLSNLERYFRVQGAAFSDEQSERVFEIGFLHEQVKEGLGRGRFRIGICIKQVGKEDLPLYK